MFIENGDGRDICFTCASPSNSMEELWRIAEDDVNKELNESRLKGEHLPFCPEMFEPFIDIKPHCSHWFFVDSSTILRNVIIVCDRVSAYVLQHERLQHEPAINKDMTVSVWRKQEGVPKILPMSILDDSLAWGCVFIQHAIQFFSHHIAA